MTVVTFPGAVEQVMAEAKAKLDDWPWEKDLGKPYGDINGPLSRIDNMLEAAKLANPPEDEVNELVSLKEKLSPEFLRTPFCQEQLAELLSEREKTHGPYAVKCEIIMAIMREVEGHRGHLSDVQNVSLDMIIHKIGRILAGDADCPDHWDDIAGYAKLVTKDLWEASNVGC